MTRPIAEIAAGLGIDDDLIPYGRDKAKIHLRALEARRSARNGKLAVVSSITPTPPGDGKTTVTIGLRQALTPDRSARHRPLPGYQGRGTGRWRRRSAHCRTIRRSLAAGAAGGRGRRSVVLYFVSGRSRFYPQGALVEASIPDR